ncbi:hypothetical protein [Flavobacterium phycosphaerae]|uniref:hypothetical protein n=1 Tax=Flavobacterium phycosphaerae TaxID=2697515 RepID=UPI001389B7DC|nr:hypothetical protein [Flavobacterium phycosphaerae]
MKIILQSNFFYQLLLALCLAVPYMGSYEITFVLWGFTVLVTLQKSYSVAFVKYLSCFILILLIAFLSTKFEGHNLFFIIRDITYLLKPILGLVLGYQICKYNYQKAFGTIANIGFWISRIHLVFLLSAVVFFKAYTVNDLRLHGGFFSDFEIYALILILFHKEFNIELSRKKFYVMAFTVGISSFLYLSRTNFIQFFILFFALKGYFILNKRAIIAILSVIGITIIGYTAILYINPRRNGEGMEAFLYKIKVAPTEPFKSKINTEDYIDFNDNYRSVETINTLKQMKNKGAESIVFGAGLGSKVDLKQEVYLGDMKIRFISVMHNALMTTYLKSGIIGIIILLFSIYLVYNQPKSSIPINQNINLMLVGTAIFLVVSNWVLMGYYFTEDSKSILVGFFMAYKEITQKVTDRVV